MPAHALDALTTKIENDARLDALSKPVASFWRRLLPDGPVRDALSGTWLAHPLHPALVWIPAGFLGGASALDALSGRGTPAARRLLGAGLLSAAPAAAAGWSDWLDTEGGEQRIGIVHASANLAGIGAYLASYLRRRRGSSGALTGLVGAGLLGFGGWLGGHLVYAQGVGVDTTAFETGPQQWTDVAAVAGIDPGLHRIEVDGLPLLLSRVAGRVVAMEARCTHRGADLTEGARDDECVVCPWHGSEFSLTTGAVTRGPATRPQPVYETREQDGRVQVRRIETRALRTNPV